MDTSAERINACALCLLRTARLTASRYGLHGEDASDCAGDFAVRMWRKGSWRLPTQEGCAYCVKLAKICAHWHILDQLRARQRRLSLWIALATDEQESQPHASSAEVALLRSELGALIKQAIKNLPPRQRLVIVRHYYCGESAARIALGLGITPGAVEQCLHRARLSLRRTLQAAGWDSIEVLACL